MDQQQLPTPPPPPTMTTSPDGRWFWDGYRWQPVSPQPPSLKGWRFWLTRPGRLSPDGRWAWGGFRGWVPAIDYYVRKGYHVTSQGPGGVQLRKGRRRRFISYGP